MPLVQISLLRGKPAPYIRAIADGVHQALVATFDTPLHDRFQIIHQLAPFVVLDIPSSSARTRQQLGWLPTGPSLLADLIAMDYSLS